MSSGLDDGFAGSLMVLFTLAIGFFLILPFAIWKWIDIIIWLWNNIHVTIT